MDNSKNKTPALQGIYSLLTVCDPGLIFQKAKMIHFFHLWRFATDMECEFDWIRKIEFPDPIEFVSTSALAE